MEKISVLMSIYKKERPCFFEEAIKSIYENQIVKPSEIILVQDGPLTKDLDNKIEKYKKKYKGILKIVPLKANVGLGEALNIGLKHCKFNLVARMDTDDIAMSDRLELQLKVFENKKNVDVVGSWVDEFTENPLERTGIRKVPEKHLEIKEFIKTRNPITHPTVMFKKKKIEEIGSYKELHLNEDYYLWGRALASGLIFYNIQKSLLYFRTGNEMFSRRGGVKYILAEYKLQKEFKRLNIINSFELIKNLVFKSPIRLMPSKLRGFIYKQFLRN